MSKLFVYGTLKRGHRAHGLLEQHDAVFLGEALTRPCYHLYKVVWFPGMVIDELLVGGVRGELYEVTEECLRHMDCYEGVPDLFRREEIALSDGSTAIAYIYVESLSGRSRIDTGVWK